MDNNINGNESISPEMPERPPVPIPETDPFGDPEGQKKALKKRVGRFYNSAAGAACIHFAILQVTAAIVQVVLSFNFALNGGDPKEAVAYLASAFCLLLANSVAYTAAHPCGTLIGHAFTKTVKESFGMFSKPQIPVLPVILGIPALFGLHSVISILQYAFTAITGSSGVENMNMDMLRLGDDMTMNILLIAYAVFIGPIGEELFFRGMIQKHLGVISPAFGIVMSSVMFGLFHGNIMQFFTGVLIGLFLAYIDYKSNSILPSMLLHIINNGIAIILPLATQNVPDENIGTVNMIINLVMGIVGLVFVFLTVNILKKRETGKGYFTPRFEYPDGEKKGFGLALAVKAPCMWVFTVIYMILIIANIVGTGAAQA